MIKKQEALPFALTDGPACLKSFSRGKLARFVLMSLILPGLVSPAFAIDHYWHGGVSSDLNDPANWTDRNAATAPTTPGASTISGNEVVRIGAAWGSEDINLDTVLNAGEDLNGNSVIDDRVPVNVFGFGGFYGSIVNGVDLGADQGGIDVGLYGAYPVLTNTYVSRFNTPYAGFFFVCNHPNKLTLKDGAFLIMGRDNANLRNGGRVFLEGRSNTNGPGLIAARDFQIAGPSGSILEAAAYTSQLMISSNGWMRCDPNIRANANAPAIRIGTADDAGTRPKGRIVIQDQGLLEVSTNTAAGAVQAWISFGNSNSDVNQIILRGGAKLVMRGDPSAMGSIGTDLATKYSFSYLTNNTFIITDDSGATLKLHQDLNANNFTILLDAAITPAVAQAWSSGKIIITFTGILQQADNASGPYTDVIGALSPYSVTPNQPQKFYRAVW